MISLTPSILLPQTFYFKYLFSAGAFSFSLVVVLSVVVLIFSCFKIMSIINNQQPKGKGLSHLDHSWICRNCFLVGFPLPFSHPLAQFKIFSILCPQVVGRCLVSARMLREDHLSLLARERSACLLCSTISRCLHKDRDRCFDHRLF